MSSLTSQFEQACSNIEPPNADVSHAADAHEAIRAVLAADETLTAWGVSTALIGSYDRHVSILRIKDVDVFCTFDALPNDIEPQALVEAVFNALKDEYGDDRVDRQKRSAKVTFPKYGELYVDAVPARRAGDHWEIPQRNDAQQPWAATDPAQMAVLSSAMNADHHDKYVPVVKLIRQARRALLGAGVRPGGFWSEMAFYRACAEGRVTPDGTLARQFTEGLEAIADLTDAKVVTGADLPNPAVEGEVITITATKTQWNAAQSKMRDAATRARDALDGTDRCMAALTFQDLLGGNDEHDHVFPLPNDCNADGTRKAAALGVTPGDRRVPAGNKRFA